MSLSPYKGLQPFQEADSPFFFGRATECQLLIANLMSNRLTLLYGASGVGKSSTLHAGVACKLREKAVSSRGAAPPEGAPVVVHAWSDNPLETVKRRVREVLTEMFGLSYWTGSDAWDLRDFLESATAAAGRELFVILDQFEECFLYHSDSDAGEEFIDQLSQAVSSPRLLVNFMFSIREDELSKLDVFEGRIPRLFDNYVRLDYLDRQAARQAITGPLKQYNRLTGNQGEAAATIEPELVEAVLSQVGAGQVTLSAEAATAPAQNNDRIETPYLQLVMVRLWEYEQAAGSTRLRLSSLETLGGAERIVRGHLDDVMAAFSAESREIAARLFHQLVTQTGSKIAHNAADLATYAGASKETVLGVLERLASRDVRVLRKIEPSPGQPLEPRYEVSHDVLAKAVLAWRRRHVQERELAAADEQRRRAEAQTRDAERRADEEARTARRFRRLSWALAAMFVAACALSATAFYERREANSARTQALKNARRAEDNAAIAGQKAREAAAASSAAEAASREAGVQKSHAENESMRARAAQSRAEVALELAQRNEKRAAEASEQATLHAKEAQRQAALASQQLTELYTEQGRRELLAARVDTSLLYLAAAVKREAQSPALRLLFAHALTLAGRQAAVLEGHRDVVTAAWMSRDEKMIVTASLDGTANLWEASSGRLIASLAANAPVTRAVFSPDGAQVLTAQVDGYANIWKVGGAGKPLILRSHIGKINDACFSPDGKWVATAGVDRTAAVWSAGDGKLAFRLEHDDDVRTVTFSADGRWLLTSSTDGLARVWQFHEGRSQPGPVLKPQTERHPLTAAVFSPNASHVAVASASSLALILPMDDSAKQIELKGHEARLTSIRFDRTGERVLTSSADGSARLWRVRDGACTAVLRAPSGGIEQAAFSPDGELIITAGRDGIARVWAADSGMQLLSLTGHTGGVISATFDRAGRKAITTGSDSTARIWDIPRDAFPKRLALHNGPVDVVEFSPDGSYLVTGGHDDLARIWRTADLSRVGGDLRHDGWVLAASFSRDGKLLATAGGKTVSVWNVADGTPATPPLVHSAAVLAARFSDDGRYLATGGADKKWTKWEVQSGRKVVSGDVGNRVDSVSFDPRNRFILTVANRQAELWKAWNGVRQSDFQQNDVIGAGFTPDGERVLLARRSGTAVIEELLRGEVRSFTASNSGSRSPLLPASFSPDGRHVLVAAENGDATVWERETGLPVSSINGQGGITSARYSPDGAFIVTAGVDGVARLWEEGSGKLLVEMQGHAGPLHSAVVGPGGAGLATAGRDGQVRIWKMPALTSEQAREKAIAVEGTMPVHLDRGEPRPGPLRDVNLRYTVDGRLPGGDAQQSDAGVYAERSRRELLDGRLPWAALWLQKAYQSDTPWAALQVLVWQAFRQFCGVQAAADEHRLRINQIARDREGRRFATVGLDGSVIVWDDEGRIVSRLEGHTDWLYEADFDPRGRMIATAGRDGNAFIWNQETGVRVGALDHDPVRESEIASGAVTVRLASERQLNSVRYDRTGALLATAGQDGVVRIWETDTRRHLRSLANGEGVWNIEFSPDGTLLAGIDGQGGLTVWDPRSGRQVFRARAHRKAINEAVFNVAGTLLATASDDATAAVWDVATGKEVARFSLEGGGHAVVFTPDGRSLLTGDDRSVRLWDVAGGRAVRTYHGHTNKVIAIDVSADGRRLLTGAQDRSAVVWDLESGRILSSLNSLEGFWTLAKFMPRRNTVMVTSGGTVRVWNPAASGSDWEQLEINPKSGVDVDARGRPVWLAVAGRKVAVRQASSVGPTVEWPAPFPVDKSALDASRQRAILASADGRLSVVEAGSGRIIAALPRKLAGLRLFSLVQADELVTVEQDALRTWDLKRNPAREKSALPFSGELDAGAITSYALSPDGRLLATADIHGAARLWALPEGKPVASLAGHRGPIRLIGFSPRSTYAYTAADDQRVRVWNVRTGQLIVELQAGEMSTAGEFTSDEALLITGDRRGSAHVWDVASGREIYRFQRNRRAIESIRYSAAAGRVLTLSEDGQAFWWALRGDLPSPEEFRQAVNRNLSERFRGLLNATAGGGEGGASRSAALLTNNKR